jgi:hypothetical protein
MQDHKLSPLFYDTPSKLNGMDNSKSLLTFLYQREAAPLFEKEGPGEISNDRSRQL